MVMFQVTSFAFLFVVETNLPVVAELYHEEYEEMEALKTNPALVSCSIERADTTVSIAGQIMQQCPAKKKSY